MEKKTQQICSFREKNRQWLNPSSSSSSQPLLFQKGNNKYLWYWGVGGYGFVVEVKHWKEEENKKIVSNLIVNLNVEKLCITEFPVNVSQFMVF